MQSVFIFSHIHDKPFSVPDQFIQVLLRSRGMAFDSIGSLKPQEDGEVEAGIKSSARHFGRMDSKLLHS